MTCLTESTNEHVVACLEEEDLGVDVARLERVHSLAIGDCRLAAARVEHERNALELGRLARYELSQVAEQLRGQVVDDPVAHVLEQLAGGRLARAGQPADDRHVRLQCGALDRGHRFVGRHSAVTGVGAGRGAFERMTRRIVTSYRMTMTTVMIVGLNGSPPGVMTTAKMAMPRIA